MFDFSIDNLSYISLGNNPLVESKQWQPEYLFRRSTRQNQGHSKLNERLKSHTMNCQGVNRDMLRQKRN